MITQYTPGSSPLPSELKLSFRNSPTEDKLTLSSSAAGAAAPQTRQACFCLEKSALVVLSSYSTLCSDFYRTSVFTSSTLSSDVSLTVMPTTEALTQTLVLPVPHNH